MSLFDVAPADAGPRRLTLIRLAGEIARAAAGVGRVVVEGEVHRPTRTAAGWMYFTLRDRAAQVSVLVPRATAARSRVVAGERVGVVGQLEWHSERGQLQFRAEEITPVGAGAVAALIAETRRRLTADGLLDRPRRTLPLVPTRIAVICGSDAAVRKDIESVVADRFPGYPLLFHETTVSGPGAADAIVEGLRVVARAPGVDVVILARGGGDATALLPWSTEEVCRAVAACPVAVVSAIGHDGDRPLCDDVADLRCGTPSIAAASVVPSRAELQGRLDARRTEADGALRSRLVAAGTRLSAVDTSGALLAGVTRAADRLGHAGSRLGHVHPARHLEQCRSRLRALDWRRAMGEIVGRAGGRLDADARHLRALSPARTLDRGYAVVTRDQTVVRRVAQVRAGDRIDVRVADGVIGARVEEIP